MTPRKPILAAALNTVFSLRFADAAEARAWLDSGGWQQFDSWVAAHRGMGDDEDPAARENGESERTAL